ncbi:hypothetical protein AM1_3910 [Acaryochloris marina MBIC11017]|uniref:Uncharacterized protein n=2 Tax=Acaryochloris marina TaxID=155978 RepID=B0C875_ACAM1|nr:hypothetical protein AM1_3910 [Acaryochloris marina MBIC11017]BDM77872.1 hypothetical protein AM10699_07420 [Acaryochloris marina MBIC10699]
MRLFVDKFMPLKPYAICQLSLLSISVCLSFPSPVRSTELSLKNTYPFSQQDLTLQESLRGQTVAPTAPLDVVLAQESTAALPTALQSPLPFALDTSASPPDAPAAGSDTAASPELTFPLTTEVTETPSEPLPNHSSFSTGEFYPTRLPTPQTVPPLLTLDQIAQVPDGPNPDESAGRRPSIRTQPSTPDEAPLDLREELLTPKVIYSPSTTILTPSAYGKSWRQASVGFGFQHRTRFTNSADGAIGVGIGLGDARKYVGLDVGLTLTDLDNFDRGIISFKLHRRLPDLFAVAVGVNDAISWGPGDIDGPSPYGVVSKTFIFKENTKDLFSRMYVSAGLGTGRYRTENNVFTDDDTPGVFGSVALRIADPVNAIAEWSGQDLSLGFSLRPFREIPLIITPAITDVTGTAGDGVRFIFGVGYAITF